MKNKKTHYFMCLRSTPKKTPNASKASVQLP